MDPGFIAFTSGILLAFATGLTLLLLLFLAKESPPNIEIVTVLALVLSMMALGVELALLVQYATSTDVVIVILFTSVNVLFPLWMIREMYMAMARILSPSVANALMAYGSLVATVMGMLLGLLALIRAGLP